MANNCSGTPQNIQHWAVTVLPSIIEQYKNETLDEASRNQLGCDNRWQACLKSVINQLQQVDNAICEFPSVFNFSEESENPTGYHLDWLAGLVGCERKYNESDIDFFNRFVDYIRNDTAGTPNFVLKNASEISGDKAPIYMENAPATYMVFTPNGNQLAIDELRNLSPAGVSGYVAAAIQFNDGTIMGDSEGKILLAEADADKAGQESPETLKEIFKNE